MRGGVHHGRWWGPSRDEHRVPQGQRDQRQRVSDHSDYLAKAHVNSGQTGGFLATDLAGLRGTSGLGSSYYGLSAETNAKAGTGWVTTDGTPTSALNGAHSQAAPVPTNNVINTYIPAGTRHYGTLN